MKKLSILVAGAVGYVLGSRAGRERYEQIKETALKVRQNPKVRDLAAQAQDAATHQAAVAKDFAVDFTKDKVLNRDDEPASKSNGRSGPATKTGASKTAASKAAASKPSSSKST